MGKQFDPEENFGDMVLEAIGRCKDPAGLIFVLLLAPILWLCHIWEQNKERKRIEEENF